MNPPPFVTNPYDPFNNDIQARLALPYHKPFLKPSSPFRKPVLQPMPSLEDIPAVKGYFLGGLLGYGRPSEEELESYRRGDNDKRPSLVDRVKSFTDENKNFIQTIYDLYRK